MQILEQTFQTTSTLHHAYFLVGDIKIINEQLISFFEKTVGLKTAGNPDLWQEQFDVFTVDHARTLADSQESKSFTLTEGESSLQKIFIIQANSITEQAQNALLKIFEEPTAGTHFFILMPQDTILPTLRSRMQVISVAGNAEVRLLHLQKMNMAERLKIVKEMSDAIKDETMTKQDAINLLNQIESEYYDDCRSTPSARIGKLAESLKLCRMTREALNDNGASIKMILENLVLSI